MENINTAEWLKYIDNWYENEKKCSGRAIKKMWFLNWIFKKFDKKNKNEIREILLKKNNLEMLSNPFTNKNNLVLLEQLNPIISTKLFFNPEDYIYNISYIKDSKNNYRYIILYYLYLCDKSIIEQIHWTYFRIDLVEILMEKKINVKKILEIINWNYIYNSKVLLNILNYNFKKYIYI